MAADQQLDQAGWKDLVDQMASRGATATDAEFDEIVQYLAGAFPAPKLPSAGGAASRWDNLASELEEG